MDKIETLSSEYAEINNIIALAKADSEIEQILLNEISQEFKDELTNKTEQIWYIDQVQEILELAKHDPSKKELLVTAIVENDVIEEELKEHFYDVFGSNGELR